MGFAVGRWDWWNLRDEHTPYEWRLQRLADLIEPLGDMRADMRAARNTAAVLSALNPDLSEADLARHSANIRNYLEINQPEDRVLLPEEAEAARCRQR